MSFIKLHEVFLFVSCWQSIIMITCWPLGITIILKNSEKSKDVPNLGTKTIRSPYFLHDSTGGNEMVSGMSSMHHRPGIGTNFARPWLNRRSSIPEDSKDIHHMARRWRKILGKDPLFDGQSLMRRYRDDRPTVKSRPTATTTSTTTTSIKKPSKGLLTEKKLSLLERVSKKITQEITIKNGTSEKSPVQHVTNETSESLGEITVNETALVAGGQHLIVHANNSVAHFFAGVTEKTHTDDTKLAAIIIGAIFGLMMLFAIIICMVFYLTKKSPRRSAARTRHSGSQTDRADVTQVVGVLVDSTEDRLEDITHTQVEDETIVRIRDERGFGAALSDGGGGVAIQPPSVVSDEFRSSERTTGTEDSVESEAGMAKLTSAEQQRDPSDEYPSIIPLTTELPEILSSNSGISTRGERRKKSRKPSYKDYRRHGKQRRTDDTRESSSHSQSLAIAGGGMDDQLRDIIRSSSQTLSPPFTAREAPLPPPTEQETENAFPAEDADAREVEGIPYFPVPDTDNKKTDGSDDKRQQSYDDTTPPFTQQPRKPSIQDIAVDEEIPQDTSYGQRRVGERLEDDAADRQAREDAVAEASVRRRSPSDVVLEVEEDAEDLIRSAVLDESENQDKSDVHRRPDQRELKELVTSAPCAGDHEVSGSESVVLEIASSVLDDQELVGSAFDLIPGRFRSPDLDRGDIPQWIDPEKLSLVSVIYEAARCVMSEDEDEPPPELFEMFSRLMEDDDDDEY